MEKINSINQVLASFFKENPSISEIPAKDLMPAFIKAGVFERDHKNGLPVRKILRDLDANNQLHQIPYVYADRKIKNVNWFFRRTKTEQGVTQERIYARPFMISSPKTEVKPSPSNRDENYVLDLCDKALQQKGLKQYKFDFLVGDAGTKLPVDSYYKDLNLVVEYREHQHSQEVKFFDKPDKLTVSGVSRGEQRKIYDQRRRDVLPEHGIKLIEIDFTHFEHDRKNRIIRNEERDLKIVMKLLAINP